MAVHLTGGFDNRLRNSISNLRQIQTTLLREREKPNTWSKDEVEALMVFFNAMNDIAAAVSLMANEVRDD